LNHPLGKLALLPDHFTRLILDGSIKSITHHDGPSAHWETPPQLSRFVKSNGPDSIFVMSCVMPSLLSLTPYGELELARTAHFLDQSQ